MCLAKSHGMGQQQQQRAMLTGVVYANAAAQLMKMIYVSSAHQANNTADIDSASSLYHDYVSLHFYHRQLQERLYGAAAPLKARSAGPGSLRLVLAEASRPLHFNTLLAEPARGQYNRPSPVRVRGRGRPRRRFARGMDARGTRTPLSLSAVDQSSTRARCRSVPDAAAAAAAAGSDQGPRDGTARG